MQQTVIHEYSSGRLIMKSINELYYGDDFRWFIGIVVNNKDPLHLGRVKVRVFGLHTSNISQISTNDLPWAQVVIPSTEGGVSGIGRSGRIKNGAQVFGFFADGKSSQIPIVIGSIHTLEKSIRTAKTPDGKHSVPVGQLPTDPDTTPENLDQRNSNSEPNDYAGKDLIGGSDTERAYNYFRSKGYSSEQAAGIVGNLLHESNMRFTNNNPGDGADGSDSIGIAQWNDAYGRQTELLNWTASQGYDHITEGGRVYPELGGQLAFVTYELDKYPYYGNGSLRNATSVEEATRIFEEQYERPSPGSYNSRLDYARQVLNTYE